MSYTSTTESRHQSQQENRKCLYLSESPLPLSHFTSKLKSHGVPILLHVGMGKTASGRININVETTVLFVQAEDVSVVSLKRRSHRKEFTLDDIDIFEKVHTQQLLESIDVLSQGSRPLRQDLLSRSLCLICRRPRPTSVELTFRTEVDRDCMWKWVTSSAGVNNGRGRWSYKEIGRSPLDCTVKRGSVRSGRFDSAPAAVDVSRVATNGVATVEVVMRDMERKYVQDILMDGVLVTQISTGLWGHQATCHLQHYHTCNNKVIKLKATHQGKNKGTALSGQTGGVSEVTRLLQDIEQVGGEYSSIGYTKELLLATKDFPDVRIRSLSLVFEDVSLDLVCASKQEARLLVEFFCEARGLRMRKSPRVPSMMRTWTRNQGRGQTRRGQQGLAYNSHPSHFSNGGRNERVDLPPAADTQGVNKQYHKDQQRQPGGHPHQRPVGNVKVGGASIPCVKELQNRTSLQGVSFGRMGGHDPPVQPHMEDSLISQSIDVSRRRSSDFYKYDIYNGGQQLDRGIPGQYNTVHSSEMAHSQFTENLSGKRDMRPYHSTGLPTQTERQSGLWRGERADWGQPHSSRGDGSLDPNITAHQIGPSEGPLEPVSRPVFDVDQQSLQTRDYGGGHGRVRGRSIPRQREWSRGQTETVGGGAKERIECGRPHSSRMYTPLDPFSDAQHSRPFNGQNPRGMDHQDFSGDQRPISQENGTEQHHFRSRSLPRQRGRAVNTMDVQHPTSRRQEKHSKQQEYLQDPFEGRNQQMGSGFDVDQCAPRTGRRDCGLYVSSGQLPTPGERGHLGVRMGDDIPGQQFMSSRGTQEEVDRKEQVNVPNLPPQIPQSRKENRRESEFGSDQRPFVFERNGDGQYSRSQGQSLAPTLEHQSRAQSGVDTVDQQLMSYSVRCHEHDHESEALPRDVLQQKDLSEPYQGKERDPLVQQRTQQDPGQRGQQGSMESQWPNGQDKPMSPPPSYSSLAEIFFEDGDFKPASTFAITDEKQFDSRKASAAVDKSKGEPVIEGSQDVQGLLPSHDVDVSSVGGRSSPSKSNSKPIANTITKKRWFRALPGQSRRDQEKEGLDDFSTCFSSFSSA